MSLIPISDSIVRLVDRIEQVLQSELPGAIAARSTPDYPLTAPRPFDYIVGDETITDVFRHLGGPDLYCSIIYESSELVSRGTGDGTEESYSQVTQVGVSIVMKRPAGADLPTRNGRKLLIGEWMRHRAEVYRGVLIDVLCGHAGDCVNINQAQLVRSAVSPPVVQNNETYREAAVLIECVQHVAVPIPH